MAPADTVGAQTFTLGPSDEPFTDFNPCTGEVVTGVANSRFDVYTKSDGAGGVHFTVRILMHGSGQSTTGAQYQFNSEDVTEANATAGGTQEQTTVINHVLIRQGTLRTGQDDFLMKDTLHFTFSVGGAAVFVEKGHTSCPTDVSFP